MAIDERTSNVMHLISNVLKKSKNDKDEIKKLDEFRNELMKHEVLTDEIFSDIVFAYLE